MVGEFGFDRGLDQSAAEHARSAITAMRRASVCIRDLVANLRPAAAAGLNERGLYGLYDDQEKLTAPGKAFLDVNYAQPSR